MNLFFAVLPVYFEVCETGQPKIEQLVSIAMCGTLGSVADDYLDLEQLFGFSVGRDNIHASRETRRREQRASIFSTFYNVSFVLMKSM